MTFIVTKLKILALSMLRFLYYCVLTVPFYYYTTVSYKNDCKCQNFKMADFYHDNTYHNDNFNAEFNGLIQF